jgi:hypothetical protein
MNPINSTDPFGLDSDAGWIASSINKSYGSHNRGGRNIALTLEGATNSAIQVALWVPKLSLLIPRLIFGIDFDISVNYSGNGPIVNAGIRKSDRKEMVKHALIIPALADVVSQTGNNIYFGYFYKGGESSLAIDARENLMRTSGGVMFGIAVGKIFNYAEVAPSTSGGNALVHYDTYWNNTPKILDYRQTGSGYVAVFETSSGQAHNAARFMDYQEELARIEFTQQAKWKPLTHHGEELIHHAYNRHPSMATTESGLIDPLFYDSSSRANILNMQSEIHSLGGGRYAAFNTETGEFTVFSWQGGGGLAPNTPTIHSYYIPLRNYMRTGVPFQSKGIVNLKDIRPK